jgi:hypothetical protein
VPRHVQERVGSRAQGQAARDGFSVEPNGVMAKCPSKIQTRRRPRARRAARCPPWLVRPARHVHPSPATRWPRRSPGGRRRSRALIESGVGAFYMTARADDGRLGLIVHAFVTGNYAIKYVQRYSDARSRWPTRSRRTGAGSTARSCSGCSCCRCSARSPSRPTASATAS